MHPRLFQFGHIAIPAYGIFAAMAILAALAAATLIARRLALDPGKIWNLSLIAIFTTLLGSRLLLILFHLPVFLAHPFWVLGLVAVRSNGIFDGSLLLAVFACTGYLLANQMPFLRTLDCLAPAAALGLGIRSLGALAAGSEYGSSTTTPWGVTYTHRLAALWSGTPLGVRLHPVQLYEAAILFLLFAILLFLLRRESLEGTLAGLFLFIYGASLYFLDFYRGNRSFIFADTLSIVQLIGIALVLIGSAFLLITDRQHTRKL